MLPSHMRVNVKCFCDACMHKIQNNTNALLHLEAPFSIFLTLQKQHVLDCHTTPRNNMSIKFNSYTHVLRSGPAGNRQESEPQLHFTAFALGAASRGPHLMIQLPSIRMVQHHWDNDSFAITELTSEYARRISGSKINNHTKREIAACFFAHSQTKNIPFSEPSSFDLTKPSRSHTETPIHKPGPKLMQLGIETG